MDYQKAFEYIVANLVERQITDNDASEGYDPNIKPKVCTSFEALIDSYAEVLHVTKGISDTVAVMLAVNLSLKLGGNPLWMYVIGPPSSGKSTLAACMEPAIPYCFSLSKMTGIFSGYRSADGADCSLLPRFQDRTVIVKDWTTILKLPPTTQEVIYGELRDLYDGSASVHYRSQLSYRYTGVRFSMLACVTDAVRAYNRTGLGERFLQIEIDSEWTKDWRLSRSYANGNVQIERAIDNSLDELDTLDIAATGDLLEQKCTTWGFLDYLHGKVASQPGLVKAIVDSVKYDAKIKTRLSAIAQWVSFARSSVERDTNKQLKYRPRVELGARLSKQLVKLTVSLCLIFGIDYVDDRVLHIISKVGMDTAISFQLEIMLALSREKSGQGMTKDGLANELSLSITSVTNLLNDMQELGVVTMHKTTRTLGRPANLYRMTPTLSALARTLGMR